MVSSRKQEAVDAVAKAIQAAGGEADAVAAHAGSIADLQALVDKTVARFGGVDIIVNNAAANPVFGPIVMADEGVFDKIMAVNVKGPLELAKRAFPIMAERGGGSVINISSIGGISPEPMLGIYSVSKAALISLTKVLAAEWGAGEDSRQRHLPGPGADEIQQGPVGDRGTWKNSRRSCRWGAWRKPDEIAPMAVFLAGDAAAYCTGGVYLVDGGHTI